MNTGQQSKKSSRDTGLASLPADPLRPKPSDAPRSRRQVLEHNVEAIHEKLQEIQRGEPASLKEAVKTITFWKLLVMVYGVSLWNYYICSNWKFVYETAAALAPWQHQLSLAAAVTIFSAFSFAGVMKSYGLGVMYVTFGSGCLGILTMIFSTITSKLFGEKAGPMVYPFVLLSMTLANFSQHFFFRYYVQQTRSLEAMYYFFGAICVVGLLASVWIVLRPNRWAPEQPLASAEAGPKDAVSGQGQTAAGPSAAQ